MHPGFVFQQMMLDGLFADNTRIAIAMQDGNIHPGILGDHGTQIRQEVAQRNDGTASKRTFAVTKCVLDFYESRSGNFWFAKIGTYAADFGGGIGYPLPAPSCQPDA